MTPEERAVIDAALAYGRDDTSCDAHNDLIDALNALVAARTKPCGALSPSGAMMCESWAGHSSEATVRRLHHGKSSNGAVRRWWEWL